MIYGNRAAMNVILLPSAGIAPHVVPLHQGAITVRSDHLGRDIAFKRYAHRHQALHSLLNDKRPVNTV
jgi:hypothetical protein